MPGRLILCATPIGNLDDASARLRQTLEEADVVFAEDTRRTRKLLGALAVSRPLRSFFAGNEQRRAEELRARLEAGETVALVTDAGTPGVADPGLSAVRIAEDAGAAIGVVPGPSAVTAAVAVSGLPAERFVFEGFLPRGGERRRRRLDEIASESRTIVLFSATRRVVEDLSDLAGALGGDRAVVVVRELTKIHEERWPGTLAEAVARWSAVEPMGEFTLVVAGAPEAPPDLDAALEDVAAARAQGRALSTAVKAAAERHGVARSALYGAAVEREAQVAASSERQRAQRPRPR